MELGFPYQTSTPPKPLLLTVNPSPSAHKVWSSFTLHAGPLPISRLSLPETGRSGLAFNPGNSRGRNSLRDKTFTYVFIAYHCKLFLPCDRWPDHQGCQVAFPIKQQERKDPDGVEQQRNAHCSPSRTYRLPAAGRHSEPDAALWEKKQLLRCAWAGSSASSFHS